MSKDIKLKPCPFCGNAAITTKVQQSLSHLNYAVGVVKCDTCGAMIVGEPMEEAYVEIGESLYRKTPYRSGLEIAIECWNTRAGEEA